MCLIIDVNVASDFACAPPKIDAQPIMKWILQRNGKIAIGGKLSEEYTKSSLRDLLLELYRKGSVHVYKREQVDTEEAAVEKLNLCESDDPHIIALARVSGCRLLFSRDKPLHNDFKNKKLLDKPRGSIYSRSGHSKLLGRCPACK